MRDRLAAETSEEGEARLQRMCTNQRDRLAAESVEQREDRRQRASETGTCTSREPELNFLVT